jgi:hypothetical protein
MGITSGSINRMRKTLPFQRLGAGHDAGAALRETCCIQEKGTEHAKPLAEKVATSQYN